MPDERRLYADSVGAAAVALTANPELFKATTSERPGMVPCLLASASLSLLSVMSESTDAPNTVLTVAAGSPELIILSALAGQQFYSGEATLLKLQLLPASSTLLRSVPAVLTTYPRDMSCHQFRGCRVFGSRSSAVALRPCRLKGQCLLRDPSLLHRMPSSR